MKRLSVAFTVIGVILGIAYPFAIYWSATHWGARAAGLLVVAFLLPRALVALREKKVRDALVQLRLLLPVLVCAVLASIIDDQRFLLAQPVIVNLGFFATFAYSLRTEQSIIERFALMHVPDLTPPELRYCRAVTVTWCVFFVLNATTAAVLALVAPLSWWTVYNGGVAYGLMGLLFAAEFVIRKIRFRRYGKGPHDLVFARLFPRRVGDP